MSAVVVTADEVTPTVELADRSRPGQRSGMGRAAPRHPPCTTSARPSPTRPAASTFTRATSCPAAPFPACAAWRCGASRSPATRSDWSSTWPRASRSPSTNTLGHPAHAARASGDGIPATQRRYGRDRLRLRHRQSVGPCLPRRGPHGLRDRAQREDSMQDLAAAGLRTAVLDVTDPAQRRRPGQAAARRRRRRRPPRQQRRVRRHGSSHRNADGRRPPPVRGQRLRPAQHHPEARRADDHRPDAEPS